MPEYDLPKSTFDEVASFLLRKGARIVASGRGGREDVTDFDFEGNPVVIINKGFFRNKKTIHMSRDTADTFGEAGIKLHSVKNKGAH